MDDPIASLSERLTVLIEGGQFETWSQLAGQLAQEGYAPKLIAGVGRDRRRQSQIAEQLLSAAMSIEERARKKADAKRVSPALRMDAMARRR